MSEILGHIYESNCMILATIKSSINSTYESKIFGKIDSILYQKFGLIRSFHYHSSGKYLIEIIYY